jgi:hypothetical protein
VQSTPLLPPPTPALTPPLHLSGDLRRRLKADRCLSAPAVVEVLALAANYLLKVSYEDRLPAEFGWLTLASAGYTDTVSLINDSSDADSRISAEQVLGLVDAADAAARLGGVTDCDIGPLLDGKGLPW